MESCCNSIEFELISYKPIIGPVQKDVFVNLHPKGQQKVAKNAKLYIFPKI